MTPYSQHRDKWKNCELCNLCERRGKVVLARGTVPADVLFVGEAPGVSEDVLGRPFVGPAGKLLDTIIYSAKIAAMQWPENPRFAIAFTNIIACIPKNGGAKIGEPPKYAVEACSDRLTEFIALCNPRLIVAVGKFAINNLGNYTSSGTVEVIEIVHPAAILRADVTQKGMQTQRAVATLADALSEL